MSSMIHSRIQPLNVALILCSVLALALSGCGKSDPPKDGDSAKSKPKTDPATKPSGKAPSGETKSGGAESDQTKGKGAPDSPAGKYVITGDVRKGRALVRSKCSVCHKVDGRGGTQGPAMNEGYKSRLLALMDNYPTHIARLKNINPKRYEKHQEQIESVLNATDPNEKLALWFSYYTKKPTFDRDKSKMLMAFPNLKDEELENIVAFILSLE